MIGMIIIYKEALTFLKIAGIVLALIGVLLVSWEPKGSREQNNAWKMLIILFIGSGILDLCLNYAQQNVLNELTPALFSAFGFLIAGFIGLLVLIWQFISRSSRIKGKNILAGLILGIPNYFSIYLLLQAYEVIDYTSSSIVAIVNVSVVVLSALFGFMIFKEDFSIKKAIGLIASLMAILALYFAT